MHIRDLMDVLGNNPQGREAGSSVVEHMGWLLNTHQGTVKCVPDYGMPDFEEFLSNANVEKILAGEIRELLEKFEPRLTQIRVFPAEGKAGEFHAKLNVTMCIEAVLADADEFLKFEEQARVGHMGDVDLN